MGIDISNLSNISLSKETLSLVERISSFTLGENYELSLVFCNNELSQELNRTHREKDYPTNILSFTLSDSSGEIFIDLEKCETEAENFEREFENFVVFLFIHGVMHLKGFDHGSTMEEAEQSVRSKFKV